MKGVGRTTEEIEDAKQRIIDYMLGAYGRTFYAACESAAVGMSEAYTWRHEDENFERAIKGARKANTEGFIDAAQGVMLSEVMKNKNWRAAKFVLETLGKDRGYVKRDEHTGKDGASLVPLPGAVTHATEEEALAAAMERLQRPPQA